MKKESSLKDKIVMAVSSIFVIGLLVLIMYVLIHSIRLKMWREYTADAIGGQFGLSEDYQVFYVWQSGNEHKRIFYQQTTNPEENVFLEQPGFHDAKIAENYDLVEAAEKPNLFWSHHSDDDIVPKVAWVTDDYIEFNFSDGVTGWYDRATGEPIAAATEIGASRYVVYYD